MEVDAQQTGTLRDIYEDNLVAESHFRYIAKGGIAYNHVADTYVALFSTFMRCGLWEAVSILDGLLKNEATIKPTIVHADTQGQSTAGILGLCYLLGIELHAPHQKLEGSGISFDQIIIKTQPTETLILFF